jgi:predicted exporter
VKRISSRFNKPLIWLAVHAGVAAALGVSLLFGSVRLNTNLFDILPGSHALKSVASAEKTLSDRNGRHVSILAGNPDFAEAKRAAAQVYHAFADSGAFEYLSLYVDETGIAQCTEYLHEYRYMLLDLETRRLLETGGAQRVAEDALASAFGMFTAVPLDTIETDPFLLANREMQYFLSSTLLTGGALSLREDVLAAQYEGVWYIMLRGSLTPAAVSLTNKDSGVKKIYAACRDATEKNPGMKFIYSGIPFHSYESSSKAQREISLISAITLGIIIALFWYVFRSPLPALVSAGAAGVSILFATAAALLLFRNVHILTFVFGTTLIGTCVDYSIHFFIRWKNSGENIEAHIFRGIAMSFGSTVICFAALFLAPFPILKQFAVFSGAGLFSSFLSVMRLYPLLKAEKGAEKQKKYYRTPPNRFPRIFKKAALFLIFIAATAMLFINRDNLRVENDITGLYTMSETLMESERIAAQALNYGSSGRYFIVSGDSAEETLQREEALRERLETEIAQGNLQSYAAASVFVPSIHTQQSNYAAASALLPLASAQFESLGFPASAADLFRRDFSAAGERYVLPDGELPGYLDSLVSNLWIGNPGGTSYYSCVLPLHTKDEASFQSLTAELEGVVFVNKAKDISTELNDLTRTMLLLFLAAYIGIALLIRRFYSLKHTLRICAVPFLLILVSLAVLACLDIPLGFFSAVGLVLAFGLGLDYMFYLTESENAHDSRSLTLLAIGLSFATTALSFGALALSSFAPAHIFGLTAFTGLTAAFISAMLLMKNEQ